MNVPFFVDRDDMEKLALFCRPRCPRLCSVERITLNEADLSTDVIADNDNTKQWENVRDLPLLPSFVKAFNIEGILVCIAFKAADGERR